MASSRNRVNKQMHQAKFEALLDGIAKQLTLEAQDLQDIEVEMRSAAERLNSAVFIEYWGHDVVAERRIAEWLRKADKLARDWRPSDVLFQGRRFT